MTINTLANIFDYDFVPSIPINIYNIIWLLITLVMAEQFCRISIYRSHVPSHHDYHLRFRSETEQNGSWALITRTAYK